MKTSQQSTQVWARFQPIPSCWLQGHLVIRCCKETILPMLQSRHSRKNWMEPTKCMWFCHNCHGHGQNTFSVGGVRPPEHVASRSEDVERDSKAETEIAGLQQLFQVCGLFVLPNLRAVSARANSCKDAVYCCASSCIWYFRSSNVCCFSFSPSRTCCWSSLHLFSLSSFLCSSRVVRATASSNSTCFSETACSARASAWVSSVELALHEFPCTFVGATAFSEFQLNQGSQHSYRRPTASSLESRKNSHPKRAKRASLHSMVGQFHQPNSVSPSESPETVATARQNGCAKICVMHDDAISAQICRSRVSLTEGVSPLHK